MNAGTPRTPLACFAARSRDGTLLRASSSGGIFPELARAVLARGGAVAGAAWDRKTWQVVHRVVRDGAGLAELAGSKYVFSRFAGVFGEVEACLAEGRTVLFSGVPCQVAAARRRFRGAERLLTCAVVCHSGAEEGIWLAYVGELERKAASRLVDVRFRDKSDGWPRSRAVFAFADSRKDFSVPLGRCPYMGAFVAGYAARKACLSCPFRSGRGGMDILLGDFWGIGDRLPEWDDGKGASAVMVYSGRGMELFGELDVESRPVEYARIAAGNPMIERPVSPDAGKRALFRKCQAGLGTAAALRLAEEGGAVRWACHALLRRLRRLPGLRPRPRRGGTGETGGVSGSGA